MDADIFISLKYSQSQLQLFRYRLDWEKGWENKAAKLQEGSAFSRNSAAVKKDTLCTLCIPYLSTMYILPVLGFTCASFSLVILCFTLGLCLLFICINKYMYIDTYSTLTAVY